MASLASHCRRCLADSRAGALHTFSRPDPTSPFLQVPSPLALEHILALYHISFHLKLYRLPHLTPEHRRSDPTSLTYVRPISILLTALHLHPENTHLQIHSFIAIMPESGSDTESRPRRERRPSTSAPISDLAGPIGPPGLSRPKHKRTLTGFGAAEIKHIEGMCKPP